MEQDKVCLNSIKSIMSIFGSKWCFIIIDELHSGPKRFNELGRDLGINTKSLSDTLKHLEKNGVISRTVYPTVPVTVEYALTEMGRDFDNVLNAMKAWGIKWLYH